ncbi:hypothetical protein HZS_906 [Henneguya salminicola]|nr:hypothetical protein HZS_906 [Henneguya salminicola]
MLRLYLFHIDILHKFDILEDAAIAYGYNNIRKQIPKIPTTSSLTILNRFSDLLRSKMVNIGFVEGLSFILASMKDMCFHLNIDDKYLNLLQSSIVKIDSSYEHNCVRNSLIPGLLRTISSNQKLPLPIKLFEVSDIVLKNDQNSLLIGKYIIQ